MNHPPEKLKSINCEICGIMMDKEYYYKCDCGAEMLVMEPEVDKIDNDKLLFFLNLSIWLQGCDNKPTFYERLRHCYNILKTGKNYSDQIILSFEQASKLQHDLRNIMSNYEEASNE